MQRVNAVRGGSLWQNRLYSDPGYGDTCHMGTETDKSGVLSRYAKYSIGDRVRHRFFSFRGVIYDVDPVFSNTEEWYQAIPAKIRPDRDQPFYHLLAENEESTYEAYVSEQNLLPDDSDEPCRHPDIDKLFRQDKDGRYRPRQHH